MKNKTVREYLERLTCSRFLDLVASTDAFKKSKDPKRFWLNTVAKYTSTYPSHPIKGAHILFNVKYFEQPKEVLPETFVVYKNGIRRSFMLYAISHLLDLEVKDISAPKYKLTNAQIATVLFLEMTFYGYTDTAIKRKLAKIFKDIPIAPFKINGVFADPTEMNNPFKNMTPQDRETAIGINSQLVKQHKLDLSQGKYRPLLPIPTKNEKK